MFVPWSRQGVLRLFSDAPRGFDVGDIDDSFIGSYVVSLLTPKINGVGGEIEEWNFQSDVSISGDQFCPRGEDWVSQRYDLKKPFVYYPQPEYWQQRNAIDPATATDDDIRNHALVHQDLDPTTVNKYINYLSKMRSHPVYPVNLKHPDFNEFCQYMDHIKVHGDLNCYGKLRPVHIHGLINRRKAWRCFLIACGREYAFPAYEIKKRKIPDNSRNLRIPTPETVYQMLHHKYVKNRDLNLYLQYHFFFGFFIGMACEKEMAILDVDDIVCDSNGNYTILITRPKVGNKKRILKLEKTLAVSPVHKSVRNYLKYVRPKWVNPGTRTLFADPETGERWDLDRLRHFLTRYGKQVYPPFFPYLMRHWCGTARHIDWDREGNAFARVQYWLGHKDPKETRRYVDLAPLFDDHNGSWLGRALKRDFRGGLDDQNKNAQQTAKTALVAQNTKGQAIGTPQARFWFQSGVYTTIRLFLSCCVKGIVDNSLKPFFLFFCKIKPLGVAC